MRIAFTHNLQLSASEDEAEFDRPETVAVITAALRILGHEVEPIDVMGPASRVVARLEALAPDLIFNTAEGSYGRFREAFYPALFDRLGLPFTGSDAYVCAVTLDKQLTKLIVSRHGVATPEWAFVLSMDDLRRADAMELKFPVIVKPNYEGSSLGITRDSIVWNKEGLRLVVEQALGRFGAGLIVEEFIKGRDLTVPYLERVSFETGGVLEPAQYKFISKEDVEPGFEIYDYDMKSVNHESVRVIIPADITPGQKEEVRDSSLKVVKALGIRDMGRMDYRIGEDGKVYFIEVNALPSLEPGASIYESAKLAGLGSLEKVMDSIVQSASDRFGINIPTVKKVRQRRKIKVCLTYNLRRIDNAPSEFVDDEAEFDSPDTISAIKSAIESYGHQVIELEATPEFSSLITNVGADVVFNVAEGIGGRSRESQVPAVLELLGIPYTGSDPTALSVALDKALAKRIAIQAGLSTPHFIIMNSGKERLPKALEFPVIVKPIAEGSSKGILKASVVDNEADLRRLAQEVTSRYKQSILVERFLPGREFTIALLGEKRPRVLPPMEILFLSTDHAYPVYSFESKFESGRVKFEVPANVTPDLRRELEAVSRCVFSILGCRDLARVDLRLDQSGKVNFIECNPLPGLTPGFSDFCVIAEAAGMNYRSLIGEILAPVLRRVRERQKERLISGGVV